MPISAHDGKDATERFQIGSDCMSERGGHQGGPCWGWPLFVFYKIKGSRSSQIMATKWPLFASNTQCHYWHDVFFLNCI